MLSFESTFSLSSFTFIKRLFSSSSLSAIRVVSSAYLRLLISLPAVLIPACASSSPALLMMYSAYKLNKQGDNIQPWCTPFPIWNQSVVCSVSSSNCCFLTCIQISQKAGHVVWYSHLFQNFPQFIVIHTVKGFDIVNKAEIDTFLELSCFFNDPADVGNLISGYIVTKTPVFRCLTSSLNPGKHYLLDCESGDWEKDMHHVMVGGGGGGGHGSRWWWEEWWWWMWVFCVTRTWMYVPGARPFVVLAQISVPSIPYSLWITNPWPPFSRNDSLAPIFTHCNSVFQIIANYTGSQLVPIRLHWN